MSGLCWSSLPHLLHFATGCTHEAVSLPMLLVVEKLFYGVHQSPSHKGLDDNISSASDSAYEAAGLERAVPKDFQRQLQFRAWGSQKIRRGVFSSMILRISESRVVVALA